MQLRPNFRVLEPEISQGQAGSHSCPLTARPFLIGEETRSREAGLAWAVMIGKVPPTWSVDAFFHWDCRVYVWLTRACGRRVNLGQHPVVFRLLSEGVWDEEAWLSFCFLFLGSQLWGQVDAVVSSVTKKQRDDC